MAIVLWLAVSILIGTLASGKGRSAVGWFFLSIFLSPIVGGIALLIAGEKKD